MPVKADWNYSVRPGDTFWSVCAEYSDYPRCWQELPGYNNVTDPSGLAIGQRLRVPVAWLKQAPAAATVLFAQGEVFYATESQQKPLRNATELVIGSRIITRQGSATLRFVDGSLLTMAEFSEITLDAVSAFKQSRSTSIRVSVPRGEVDVRVPPRQPRTRFELQTPSAVAAVRGTRFRVNSDPNAQGTRGEVLRGKVDLSAAGATTGIDAGFGSKTEAGRAPIDPVQLLDAPAWNLSCTDPGYAEWFAAPQAIGYKLVLLEDDLSVDRVLATRTITDTNYTFHNLENKCYQLRVNAVDGQGFNGLESQRRFCYNLQLAAPQLTAVRWQRGELSVDWSDVAYAESYRVQIARDENFEQVLQTGVYTPSELEAQLDAYSGPVFVRARAEARDGSVAGEFSQPLSTEHSNPRHWLLGLGAVLLAFIAL
ncbi:MAG: LysM peptidoglycan-binding domain-containing protein [Pseudomonadales bacterium]|nr:FecR domain-containing protein [Gammaproteobacteria bacterium]NNL56622.1 LysM peptidoglycan-binding domain-containing protein [Pseudomonadales bacterium]